MNGGGELWVIFREMLNRPMAGSIPAITLTLQIVDNAATKK